MPPPAPPELPPDELEPLAAGGRERAQAENRAGADRPLDDLAAGVRARTALTAHVVAHATLLRWPARMAAGSGGRLARWRGLLLLCGRRGDGGAGFRVEEMQAAALGQQPDAGADGRVDAGGRAQVDQVVAERDRDQRLVSERLDHVHLARERAGRSRGDHRGVLGPEAEHRGARDRSAPAGRSIPARARRRRTVTSPLSTFIGGDPQKRATNRLAGRAYRSAGVASCCSRPSCMTATMSAIVIASTWSWVT